MTEYEPGFDENTELSEEHEVIGVYSPERDWKGDRYEHHKHHTHSAIIKTHQQGQSLQNKWGGYTTLHVGSHKYVAKKWKELQGHYNNPKIRSFAGVEADRKAANAATKKEETMIVLATNPMQRGFIEQAHRQAELAAAPRPQITEAEIEEAKKSGAKVSVKDHKGDKWTLRSDLVRNETHPNYWKPTAPADKGTEKSLNRVSGWHNDRTGEVHEGGVTLGLGGHATMGTGDYGSPRMYHISHYKTGIKEEVETVDESKVDRTPAAWEKRRERWKGFTKRDKAAGIKPPSKPAKEENKGQEPKKEENEAKGFRKLLKKVSVVPNVAATGAP